VIGYEKSEQLDVKPAEYFVGLAVREILWEVGFRELMQRGAKSGVFHLETR
jgi:hypothetical protein